MKNHNNQSCFSPSCEKDLESYRRQYRHEQSEEASKFSEGTEQKQRSSYQTRSTAAPGQHAVHIGNINDIIAAKLQSALQNEIIHGKKAKFDFRESLRCRESDANAIVAVADAMLQQAVSNALHVVGRESLINETKLRNQREMRRLHNTSHNSKYSNEEYSSFFKAARTTIQGQYEEYKDPDSQSSGAGSSRSHQAKLRAEARVRSRNASPSEVRYSSIDHGRQRPWATPREAPEVQYAAVNIERLDQPHLGQSRGHPSSGNISSNSSDDVPTSMAKPMNILTGGLQPQIAMNNSSLRGVQTSPSKILMDRSKQSTKQAALEGGRPSNRYRLPVGQVEIGTIVHPSQNHIDGHGFIYPNNPQGQMSQNAYQIRSGQVKTHLIQANSAGLIKGKQTGHGPTDIRKQKVTPEIQQSQVMHGMDPVYKSRPPKHQHQDTKPNSQVSALAQLQDSFSKQFGQLFGPAQQMDQKIDLQQN